MVEYVQQNPLIAACVGAVLVYVLWPYITRAYQSLRASAADSSPPQTQRAQTGADAVDDLWQSAHKHDASMAAAGASVEDRRQHYLRTVELAMGREKKESVSEG